MMQKQLKEYITPPIILIIILLALSFMIMTPVLNMVIFGAILAFLIRPISLKIQNKLKYPSISIILSILMVIIPLILLLVYMLWVIFGVASDFLISNPSIFNFNQTIGSYSFSLSDYLDSIVREIGTFVIDYIVSLAKKLPEISIQLFILFCSLFYFSRDGNKAYNFLEDLIPESQKDFFKNTVSEIKNVLLGIFYGHFLTALIIGIMAAIGYSILGYHYGVFLGVLTGIFQLIPIIGPWPIYWALTILDIIHGNYIHGVFVFLFGLVLSLSDMYIRPALSSHYADIHPLILLIGFLAGPLVYGIIGFILGPLILGITYAVFISYKKNLKVN